jgi:predicted tellurium resistance membrane protein TerC
VRVDFSALFDFSWVSNPSAWIGLLTLVALEIVLGIDNIVFISILSGKLPPEQQPKARKMGLILAVIPRIVLLLALPFVLRLTKPVVTVPIANIGLSVQDLIVIIGGLFLLAKATHEIHGKLEGDEHVPAVGEDGKGGRVSYSGVLTQIMLLNIVFSLDSIVTAIGMVPPDQVMVMVLAVLIATVVMAIAVNSVSAFVEKHPTVKMLALSFLLLIGTTLIIEGFHAHIPKGYVYFAMAFSVFVEVLNIKSKQLKSSSVKPVVLREPRS